MYLWGSSCRVYIKWNETHCTQLLTNTLAHLSLSGLSQYYSLTQTQTQWHYHHHHHQHHSPSFLGPTYPYFSPITFFLSRFLSSLSTSLLSSPVKGRKGISHPTLPLVYSVVYYVLPRHTRVVSLIRGEAHQARTHDIIRTNSFIVLYYCNHKHELIINVM